MNEEHHSPPQAKEASHQLGFKLKNPLAQQNDTQQQHIKSSAHVSPISPPENRTPSTTPSAPNWRVRKFIFVVFLLMNIFLNFDTGVMPAAILQMQRDLGISKTQIAYLGSCVYLGLCVSSLFVSLAFSNFSAPRVLFVSVTLNAAACFVFSASQKLWVLYAMRVGLGLTQAFVVIYAPVWINEYAPSSASTRWLAAVSVTSLVGVLAGYAVATVCMQFLGGTWRHAIQVQAAGQLVLGLTILCTKEVHVNLPTDEHDDALGSVPPTPTHSNAVRLSQAHRASNTALATRSDIHVEGLDVSDWRSLCAMFRQILSNGFFVCTSCALCSIYFITSGAQFWTTAYMVKVLGQDRSVVFVVFLVLALTAPLIGVSLGSTLSD